MMALFQKNFTKDNKLSACYVVDRLQQILNIDNENSDEFGKQTIAIHEFKNELIHDMEVIVMSEKLREGK